MSAENGGSAFPSHGSMGEVEHRGMSLRDWMAGQALVGLIASAPPVERENVVDQVTGGLRVSRAAYMYADAMLAQRAKATGAAP